MLYQKIKIYIPYIASVVMVLLYFQQCDSNNKERADIQKDWKYKEFMYENNAKSLIRDTTKKGLVITSQELLIVTKDTEKEMLLIENKRLKNIKSEVRVVTKTEIKDVLVPFEKVVHDTITNTDIMIFRVQDQWYGVSGRVLSNGVMIDSMSFTNELVVTIGERSNGMFKKKTPVVDIINKNPFSSTDEVYNVLIEKNPKKFWQKRGFQMGMSAVVGTVVGIQLMK